MFALCAFHITAPSTGGGGGLGSLYMYQNMPLPANFGILIRTWKWSARMQDGRQSGGQGLCPREERGRAVLALSSDSP